ncbi:MAG: BtrH N-terminal domain-containing protein, partial [Desulfobacterales bacterium]|nr:BtrH N-terminal domain-containing protein [Desulfobacterales bacterium]
FPFIRLNHLPLSAFRISTGGIMKRVCKRLKVSLKWEKFRDPQKAMDVLDQRLAQQIPVGCRTGAFWLSYFPRQLRFHFNMHNLVVFGKIGSDYLISDPVFPDPVVCSESSLRKARFAKGAMPPKGKMYHIESIPEQVDLQEAISGSIKEVCRNMLKAPIPFIGVKGIRYLAKKMEKWPVKLGEERASLYLGQIIRMQEEIGTGGAGFRFIYAAFLQEVADILNDNRFLEFSSRMTGIGDQWRTFALMASRNCKKRASETENYLEMADILRNCADGEAKLLTDLGAIIP